MKGWSRLFLLVTVLTTCTSANAEYRVGFAKFDITPQLDHDIYLGGYTPGRKATAVHDKLWARGCALSDGETNVVFVSIDALGILYDDVLRVRRSLQRNKIDIDLLIVCATGTHNAPDTIGLWGEAGEKHGRDERYAALLREQIERCASRALANMKPQKLIYAEYDNAMLASYIPDHRQPLVRDGIVRFLGVTDKPNAPISGMVAWGNLPAVYPPSSTLISADFAQSFYLSCEQGHSDQATRIQIKTLRDIEKESGNTPRSAPVPILSQIDRGQFSVPMFFPGAVGGLDLPLSESIQVLDKLKMQSIQGEPFRMARAMGRQIAWAVTQGFRHSEIVPDGKIRIATRRVAIPLDNIKIREEIAEGRISRRVCKHGKPCYGVVSEPVGKKLVQAAEGDELRTEVDIISIGKNIAIVTIPGEIFPELVYGGIQSPRGADFPNAPFETPIVDAVTVRHVIVFGLANDYIGPIIPKAEWDEKKPWISEGRSHRFEDRSCGPKTAQIITNAVAEMAKELNLTPTAKAEKQEGGVTLPKLQPSQQTAPSQDLGQAPDDAERRAKFRKKSQRGD